MTTLNLEQGMATADTRIHPVQSSSCCSNLIKKGPTYMSATLRCNVFLRTLFLAMPPVKFLQRVSSKRQSNCPFPIPTLTAPHSLLFFFAPSHTPHRTFNTNPSAFTCTLLTVPVPYVPTPLHHCLHRWCAIFVGICCLCIVSGCTM
jgi:hypothetical protein